MTKLYGSQIVGQIGFGTLVPIALLALTQLVSLSIRARRRLNVVAGILTLIGIFLMRWNVAIGGHQLFPKSFTTYKMGFATREGLLPALIVMVLPLVVLWTRVRIFPPMEEQRPAPPPV